MSSAAALLEVVKVVDEMETVVVRGNRGVDGSEG